MQNNCDFLEELKLLRINSILKTPDELENQLNDIYQQYSEVLNISSKDIKRIYIERYCSK